MGLLNDDDQRARFFPGAAHCGLFGLDVFAVYAAGEEVADQDIGRLIVPVTAKLQHHVLSPFQVLDHLGGGVHPAMLHHEPVASEADHAVVEGA